MRLLRYKQTKTSVLGVLKGDNGDTYYTCENAETLIPCGMYNVTWHNSPTFGGKRPHLHNDEVGKGRYILIHEGNSHKDSKGCILVGNTCNLNNCTIGDSKKSGGAALQDVWGYIGNKGGTMKATMWRKIGEFIIALVFKNFKGRN